MRAAVAWKPGGGFEVRDDVERRPPRPDEIVVKIHAAGLCQTDISLADGAFGQAMPVVLGHEGAGVVTEVGSRVASVSVGDRVVVCWVPPCGQCYFCVRHQPQLCAMRRKSSESGRGIEDAALRIGDTPVIPGMGTATFAQETVLPANAVVPIPDDLPFEIAAVMGCALPTGLGASLNAARIQPGDTVLVVGCGPVGLSAVQGAVAAGAGLIVAVDPVESRRALARSLGANTVVEPDRTEELTDLTEGIGFDVGIDAVGNSRTIRSTWDRVRRGGTVVVVGAGKPDDMVGFSAYELFHEEKLLEGSFYGTCDLRRELPRMVRLWRSGRLNPQPLLSSVLDLGKINEAVELQRSGSAVRVVLQP